MSGERTSYDFIEELQTLDTFSLFIGLEEGPTGGMIGFPFGEPAGPDRTSTPDVDPWEPVDKASSD